MSDDVTEVEGIEVVGQRRSEPGQSFPSQPPPFVPPIFDEIDPVSPEDPGPCDTPETRREWNADAAAAEALSKFYAKATELQDDGLYEREFGAMIYGDEFGNVWLGPVTEGPTMGGTVVMDDTGITPGTLLGFIHTHPSPQTEPSAGDWNLFNQYYEYVGGGAGRGNLLRMYVVSRDNSEGPNSPFRIRIYTNESDQNSDNPGPEVNPEAQPCP